jgi:hypothetical protein
MNTSAIIEAKDRNKRISKARPLKKGGLYCDIRPIRVLMFFETLPSE